MRFKDCDFSDRALQFQAEGDASLYYGLLRSLALNYAVK